jgi:hypothetical protein
VTEEERLARAVQLVVDDLLVRGQPAESIGVRIVSESPAASLRRGIAILENGRYWIVELSGFTGRMEIPLDIKAPEELWKYRVADVLQDIVDEESCEPRPVCPSHYHPLSPRWEEGVACWVCPTIPSLRCAMGTYWTWRTNARMP